MIFNPGLAGSREYPGTAGQQTVDCLTGRCRSSRRMDVHDCTGINSVRFFLLFSRCLVSRLRAIISFLGSFREHESPLRSLAAGYSAPGSAESAVWTKVPGILLPLYWKLTHPPVPGIVDCRWD